MVKKTQKNDSRGLQRLLLIILAAVVAVIVGVVFIITYVNQRALAVDHSIDVGDEFLSAGEYELAEEVYLGIAEPHPLAENRLINLYTRWANSLIADNAEPAAIIQVLEKLVSHSPDNTDAYYVIASLYRADGDITAAIEACGRGLSADGTNDKLIRYFGDLLLLSDLRVLAAEHYEKYADSTGNSEYAALAKSLYPAAPNISVASGSYDDHFTFEISYEKPSYTNPAAAPVDESDVKIYYTVDGTLPFDMSSSSGVLPTFEYTQEISTARFYTGNTLVITAVAVDKYGMKSDVSVVEYSFSTDYEPVTSIKMSKTSISLEENEQTTLRVTLNPSDATNKNVIWTSSDENFVTVDENGFVTAVKFTANENLDVRTTTEKTVYVTATSLSSGLSATCEITVTPARTAPSTSFNSSKKYLEVGLKAMKEINPDVVGYIKMDNVVGVPNMPHNPIYLSENDSDFYLSHAADGTENGYGEITVPAGVRLSSLGRNTVITANYVPFGENNENYLLSVISDLDEYPAWYLDGHNHYIYLNTMDGAYIFQTFSWYHPDGSFNDYMKTDFATVSEFIDFCNGAEDANQLYNTASPNFYSADRILTLVIYKDGQVDTVIHGRAAKYKSLTSGVPSFFDDGLGKADEPEQPVTPVVPDVPVEPDQPEIPVEPDEPIVPDEPAEPEEPGELEGDLDGDGKLSVWERMQLNKKKQEEAASEGSDESENTDAEEGSDE